jgi:hypothetical protein
LLLPFIVASFFCRKPVSILASVRTGVFGAISLENRKLGQSKRCEALSAGSANCDKVGGEAAWRDDRPLGSIALDHRVLWEPMARWAIHENVARVLRNIKEKAETRPGSLNQKML